MSPVHELPLVHAFLQLIDIALRNRLVATLGLHSEFRLFMALGETDSGSLKD